jgi:membrane dipeptidase
MVRMVLAGFLLLIMITLHTSGQDRELKPAPGFADGHVHAGLVKNGDALVTSFAYFKRQGIKAICLSLPLDSSKTVDLKGRISGEIAALREFAERESAFRLLPGDGGVPGPPGGLDVFLSLEYFHGAFNGDANLVNAYRDLGIKAITLIDNARDPFFADGALTSFGKKTIALMNESGMTIDITHLGTDQKLAVIAFSRSPVLASHGNAGSVAGLDFNLTEAVVAALKEKGGSVLVSFNRNGVFGDQEERSDGVTQLLKHIDHFARRLGVDHVGIGSDYQADGRYVAAPLNEPGAFGKIATKLAGHGYDAAAIHKIMHANVLRLFGAGR